MSYKTTLNAVVTYFNIPKFNIKIDNASPSQIVYFTLTVFSGPAGSKPSIPVATTYFGVTATAGVYNPDGGITVPLSPVSSDSPSYMPTTAGVSGVTTSDAGQSLYAIQSPRTAYSISTAANPNILIVLAPSTNVTNGSVTVDVNTNNPSGMLGTLYGYIQLLSPILTFAPILTPITWTAGQTVSIPIPGTVAVDTSNITYLSSNTNVATISTLSPTSPTISMILAQTQPTTPTNVITISATRAATAIYSQQMVSINPPSISPTPQYPICIKTYALDSNKNQKIAFTNPKNNQLGINAPGAAVMIAFIASESFKTLDSLNFAINGGQYGYPQQPSGTSQSFQISLSINNTVKTTISFTTNVLSYDSNDNGTLREIPFAPLENYPTYIQSFSCTGPTPNPPCYIGDKIEITMSCNVGWFINVDNQQKISTTIVGTSLISPSSPLFPVPKILYMTSSDSTLQITSSVSSNVCNIFKRAVMTSFKITGVRPQGQTQPFTLAAQQVIGGATSSYYVQLLISFTYDFGLNYANTFTSINVPFTYTEYSRLYPTSTPMTAFSIDVASNTSGIQGVPTPFLCNIGDLFSCITFQTVSGQSFAVNTLGNIMSGSVYGYEILSNPNLRNFNTLMTPLNYLSTNYNKTIPPPGTDTSSPTFTYSVASNVNGVVAIGTGTNANKLVLSSGYSNATVSVVQSETNQYFTSSLTQNVDIITRTMLPPNTYSMTTISASSSSGSQSISQYVNVVSYSSATVPLYGYGFFNIGSSDNNYYLSSPGGQQNLSFNFVIYKYQSGGWNTVRTISISYNQLNVNSNDDGSLFIIPFYNTFANGAPTYLPFRNMPSNINGFTVVPNDTSDSNSPPIFNVGDTLQFQLSISSVNSGQTFPTNNNQLSGTVLSSSVVSPSIAVLVNPNSYSSNQWTSVSLTNPQSTSNSYPYYPPADVILTGIYLYPMANIPASTYFTIRVNLGSTSGFMTIQGVTIGANAFSGNTPIWFTMTPDYPNPNISITNISVDYATSNSWINRGQPGVSTNPLVSKSTAITFSIVFTNLGSTTYTALNYWLEGQAYSSIPGVFFGRLL
jgi:hypothetical protein